MGRRESSEEVGGVKEGRRRQEIEKEVGHGRLLE